ncbi:putative UPF0184 protein C9orf16-like [Apostichopus japonicus]|uniref:Putative UPF0184 protein C9orf16-like n=1 Tax=Stichopus japonicus TaxID=307972 RepID=A0A2G8JEY3_STIJA|nr:putative UPF0184 protein C9orf16-like [Apostichopus japonicus]
MANGPNDKPTQNQTKSGPSGNDMNDEDTDQLSNDGVASLCATIDQLDSCLDSLEQKNDSLQSKMKAFLNSMNEENSEQEKVTPEVDKKTTKDK